MLAFGFGVVPVIGDAVQTIGWRPVWGQIGYVLVFGLAPVGWLLARSSPEAYGVAPDEPAEEVEPTHPSMTLGEAVRTPAFWAFTLAAAGFNLVFSALTLDNESLLTARGLDGPAANGTVLGTLMVAGLPVNLLAGALARRLRPGLLFAAGMLLFAAALAVFPRVGSVGGAVGYAALLGAAGGVVTVVFFAAYGQVYGRAHLGLIQGFVQVVVTFASATGPVVLAVCREHPGGAEAFFYASAAAAVGLAAACAAARVGRP